MSAVDSVSKYRFIGRLGTGGMAEAFLAVTQGPAGFAKLQVVKTLFSNFASDAAFVEMFLQEARLAALLNHPNVVQTNEVGVEDGRCFLVMEYVDGQSLAEVLKACSQTRVQFPLTHHLRVLAEVLAGLHYAHELTELSGRPLGLVHRDVSPHNVLVGYDGAVKLIDFGIAKATATSKETQNDLMKGKIHYMAPEQVTRVPLDRRADIFQVGIMFAQAVTGKPYWPEAAEPMGIVSRLYSGELPILEDFGVPIDDDLAAICKRALALSRDARYATAEEFRKDIEAAVNRRDASVTPRQVGESVASLFAAHRAKVKKQIEESLQGARFSSAPLGEGLDAAPHTVPNLAYGGTNPAAITGDSSIPIASQSQARLSNTSVERGAMAKTIRFARPRRSFLLGTILAATAGVAVAALFIVPRWVGGAAVVQPADSRGADGQAASAPGPATSAPPAAAKVQVRISVEPPGAILYLDDVPLPGNPYTGRVDDDTKSHRIRAEAAGYVTREVETTWAASPSVSLTLVPAGRLGPAGVTAPPKSTSKTVSPPKIRTER